MSNFDDAISELDNIIMDTFGNVNVTVGGSDPVRAIFDSEPIVARLENGGQVVSYDAKLSLKQSDSSPFLRRVKVRLDFDNGTVEYYRVNQSLDAKDGEVVVTLSVDQEGDDNEAQSKLDVRY